LILVLKELISLENMKSGSTKKKTAMRTNYFIARENCRKGCICNKEKTVYNISNVLWEHNQMKCFEMRKHSSEIEKDELIKKNYSMYLNNQYVI